MTELTGAQAAAQAILAEDINTVFTLADGSILLILDELIDKGVNVIHVRHEQAAGNAADGWGRVTRTPGVCLVAMGPGLVNLLPSLAQAYHAGSPIVAAAINEVNGILASVRAGNQLTPRQQNQLDNIRQGILPEVIKATSGAMFTRPTELTKLNEMP